MWSGEQYQALWHRLHHIDVGRPHRVQGWLISGTPCMDNTESEKNWPLDGIVQDEKGPLPLNKVRIELVCESLETRSKSRSPDGNKLTYVQLKSGFRHNSRWPSQNGPSILSKGIGIKWLTFEVCTDEPRQVESSKGFSKKEQSYASQ